MRDWTRSRTITNLPTWGRRISTGWPRPNGSWPPTGARIRSSWPLRNAENRKRVTGRLRPPPLITPGVTLAHLARGGMYALLRRFFIPVFQFHIGSGRLVREKRLYGGEYSLAGKGRARCASREIANTP